MLASSITCRLCGSVSEYRFSKSILAGSRDCQYFECTQCGGLQTEQPTWLAQSYSQRFHFLGVDSAYRSIWAQALVQWCTTVLRCRGRILDWGGGHGLLCRLLRDIGHDAWLLDRYTENIFASGFRVETVHGFSLITTFEVFEHLANPALDTAELFTARPDIIIVGTRRYCGQGEDWNYIYPHHGQHVFFWSRGAHTWLAEQHGYSLTMCGNSLAIYTKKPVTALQYVLLKISEYGAKMMQIAMPILRRTGAGRDEAAMISGIVNDFHSENTTVSLLSTQQEPLQSPA